jgi:pimeloyl-ACP methyl ester carboxylesterase
MGGGAAIDFTLTYPDRLTALIAVAPGLGGFDYASDTALTTAREEINRVSETGDRAATVELIVRLWVDGPDRAPGDVDPNVRRRMTEMLNVSWDKGEPEHEEQELEPSAMSRLGEIRAPTLVIYGSGDVRALVGASEVVAERVPGAEVAVMAGLGHVPNMERPEEFNRLVLDFLARHV